MAGRAVSATRLVAVVGPKALDAQPGDAGGLGVAICVAALRGRVHRHSAAGCVHLQAWPHPLACSQSEQPEQKLIRSPAGTAAAPAELKGGTGGTQELQSLQAELPPAHLEGVGAVVIGALLGGVLRVVLLAGVLVAPEHVLVAGQDHLHPRTPPVARQSAPALLQLHIDLVSTQI